MNDEQSIALRSHHKLPKFVVLLTILISVLPYALHLLGVDFHTHGPAEIEAFSGQSFTTAELLQVLSGVFMHFLLEWSAVGIAACTAILAFIQYRITRNPVTPIIGMALLCAAFMDAFHALAATKIIRSLADNANFIPFTWSLARIFTAVILFLGSAIILIKLPGFRLHLEKKKTVWFISGTFIVLAYITMQVCALSESLPQTTYPENLLTRPFDALPLILFVLLGIWLFPKLHEKESNVFSHSLMWSMLPAAACQVHMVFGSSELFDAHFHMAHFLKAAAYTIPFIGMILDYLQTYTEEQEQLRLLQLAHQRLATKNKELEQFAYIASHDLQEPLRTITSYTGRLNQDYRGKLDPIADKYLEFVLEASDRMRGLIKGLLDYSRLGQKQEHTVIDANLLLKQVLEDMQFTLDETNTKITFGTLPVIKGNETEIRQLFQNLISNAIKFQPKDQDPEIIIEAKMDSMNGHWLIHFQDNGIGISQEHLQRIFVIFQRLNKRKDYEGTGIGLAHCRKIAEVHGGEIRVQSEVGKGSRFTVKLPVH